ncbi:protein FAR1-RELATED SEQUENCE 5-like isoform X1 [Amborella trichopoda]|uniref:protein FAR1-RELATED SEQUENCE 5-like isoform X1 n=1 Tax=Amborella trichopoda TaxID=13333 RepID=UPI0009BE155D|nr:protein FAR1-RELATED SEQUENCE 5-like isoform X1 [Amborella trichopoda]XP_020520997.1 protein FAR1-RELATED SEQUENCE 5-like isoform X1 [Amborella trichopoda]|eukprot:XP_020520996.1 protein FAR1-RELATED SEQUENCE 5-like isoform X1 [Amborella trichopoda]
MSRSFSDTFRRCVASPTVKEFELGWKYMIEEYELESNKWLNRLYTCRMQWVDAYLTNIFTACMTSTQRIEGMNKHLKMYLTSTISLRTVLEICAKMQDKKVRKEKENDIKDISTTPILRTTSIIESQASKIYTQKILKIFGEEVANCMNFISELVDDNGQVATFKVADAENGCRSCLVEFNSHEKMVSCNCYLFERMGLLCRHVLKIFMMKNVFEIPPPYIMRHWSKDVKKVVFLDDCGRRLHVTSELPRSIRYNDVLQAIRYLVERASESAEVYKFVMYLIHRDIIEIDGKFGCKRGPQVDTMSHGNDDASCNDTPNGSYHCENVLDPP